MERVVEERGKEIKKINMMKRKRYSEKEKSSDQKKRESHAIGIIMLSNMGGMSRSICIWLHTTLALIVIKAGKRDRQKQRQYIKMIERKEKGMTRKRGRERDELEYQKYGQDDKIYLHLATPQLNLNFYTRRTQRERE